MAETIPLRELLRLPVSMSMFGRKEDMLRTLFRERGEAADQLDELARIAIEALDLVKFANCQTDDRERALVQMKSNELRAQLAKLAGGNNA